MSNDHGVLAVATSCLRRHVQECRDPGGRLPPVKQMAAACGVSHVTMLKAVAALREEGVLLTRKRGGTVVRAVHERAARPPAVVSRPVRWRGVLERLRCDILDGVLRPATSLPPLKQLAGRYGSGYRTLQRALEALAQAGHLVSYKRGYRVPATVASEGGSQVVLIAPGTRHGGLLVTSPRMNDDYHTLERECARSGVRLTALSMEPQGGMLWDAQGRRVRSLRSLCARSTVLGFHVWTTGMGTAGVAALVALLGGMDTPLSLMDDAGDIDWPRIRLPSQARVFSLDTNLRAGEAVGRHLVRLGHRHVAFISHVGATPWSRQRSQGLRNTMDTAGGSVAEFALPQEAQASFIDPGLRAAVLDRLGVPPSPAGAATPAATLSGYHLDEAIETATAARALRPVMERALAVAAVSAWVASCDTDGVICLSFLQRHGVPVPGRLSVVGFDDAFEAFLGRLTSYNFNGTAVVHAMLRHTLAPASRRPRGDDEKAVGIGGFITERGTTGRAAAAGRVAAMETAR